MGRPLKIAKAQAVVTITATAAATDIVTTNANFTNLGIIAGMPFVPASNVGGLVAGTTYWILEVVNSGANSTFTVSATQLSANPTYTKVDLSTTSGQTVATTVGLVDSGFNNPQGASNTYGVVGGNTSIFGNQVRCRVAIGRGNVSGTITTTTTSANVIGVGTDLANTLSDGSVVAATDGTVLGYITDIANANATFATFAANSAANATGSGYVYADNEQGFIVRQKGKQKYLVQGVSTGLIAQCQTANVANAALTPNTMNIIATYANSATAFVQSLSDTNLEIFGNSAPALQNAIPAYATFNSAEAANVANGQPYPVVTINKQ
jgi:hypothetical protein